jgi:hypothetical protein
VTTTNKKRKMKKPRKKVLNNDNVLLYHTMYEQASLLEIGKFWVLTTTLSRLLYSDRSKDPIGSKNSSWIWIAGPIFGTNH